MITSTSNVRVKQAVNLKKSARARREQNCFLVEGPKMFFEAPAERLKAVYLTDEFQKKYGEKLEGRPYEMISENVCGRLSDTKTPQGVVAVVKRREYTLEEILSREETPCLLLLENIQDPGNMGTILRTAEGAGATGVVMNGGCVDPYSPKAVRSTMGAIFRIPFVVTDDLGGDMNRIKQAGVRVYAAHLEGEAVYEYDYRGPSAFLIGNESRGLTDAMAKMADQMIKIPMKGKTESLNAAVASAVLMFEVMRQRDWR